MPCSLIWKLMLYKFKQKQPKNICCAKSEGTVDHSTVTRWFKINCSGCNFGNLSRSGKSKNVDSEVMLQAIEVNLVSSPWRVSGELSMSQSYVVCHFYI